jgi:uncharacterized protein (TIGR00730 family)
MKIWKNHVSTVCYFAIMNRLGFCPTRYGSAGRKNMAHERIQVAVFCGSKGSSAHYQEAAQMVGTALAAQGAGLVYGAGDMGLMGLVARAVQEGGGYIIGVNPMRFHASGRHRMDNDEYIVVDTMFKRKELMISRADACIALPGGIGTLDEIMDVYSLRQLGIWEKPIGLLNTGHFYDGLLTFFNHMIAQGFTKPQDLDYLTLREDPVELVTTILDMVRAARRTEDSEDGL